VIDVDDTCVFVKHYYMYCIFENVKIFGIPLGGSVKQIVSMLPKAIPFLLKPEEVLLGYLRVCGSNAK
jgi:hypothetical protein